MEEQVRNAIDKALESLQISDIPYVVERPNDLSHGDYAINVGMVLAKKLGKSPRDIAESLIPAIKESLGEDASTVEVAGAGFINVRLSSEAVTRDVTRAATEGKEWGRGAEEKGKRVIVEYSCPNPFKEMHIGHLMSTIIGESVSRIAESAGATVFRDSYGGDVGPHVARAIWGLRKAGITEPTSANELGKAYAQGTRAYEESEEVKKEIDEINKAIYKGDDRELMELWRKGRDVALSSFKDIYKVLGTSFDYFFFESETSEPGMRVVQDALTKGVFEESEGAIIYKGEKKGLHTLVFITSHGTPTYETKDIGLAFLKEERCPSDVSIIITASEQIGHFKVFLAALEEIAPALAAKTSHVPHGFMRLTTGKMSSREGNVITAVSLIEDTIQKVSEKNADPIVAEQVAIGAIKYSILKQFAGSDIIFDFEKSLSTEGDSGPYLQYALVRAKSILASATGETEGTQPSESYFLERLIIGFPEVVERAYVERAPHHVAQYLMSLAAAWNSFYAKERIIGGENEGYKLKVVKAFVQTMENGLWMLGIPTPEKM